MAVGSPLGKLFGTSPIKPLQQHMQLAAGAATLLCQVVEAALRGDAANVKALALELDSTCREAEAVASALHQHLPRSLFMAVPRPDLLQLLRAQQALTRGARGTVRSVLFRPLVLPDAAHKPLETLLKRNIKLAELTLEVIERTDELLETGFSGSEARQVERKLDGLLRSVLQADRQADSLRKTLLRSEGDCDPITSLFNYRLVDALDAQAAGFSDIGERLRLLLAH